MNKDQFNTLLSHYSTSSQQEADAIIVLKNQFPFSQLLQVVAARTAKDHNSDNQQALLQMAAVYSSDRSVLKEIMATSQMPFEAIEPPVTTEVKVPANIDYSTEIVHDMERLQELKNNFEKMFMDSVPKVIPDSAATLPEQHSEPASEPETTESERKRSKRQRLIELAKELIPEELHEDPKKSVRRDSEHNPIIEEIKANKKKIQPANEKTKEQIEIIEQYISTKPARTPPKAKDETNLDFASTLKSGEFGDNIVSETLAEILVRQGKKEKAIEVYKKLIWKFPQKKAYFAAQIEDLRK